MYRVAGALVPGTDGFSASAAGVSGGVSLGLALGCGSFRLLGGSLSISASVDAVNSGGFDDYCYVSAQYSAELRNEIIFSGAITDMAAGNLKSAGSVSSDGALVAVLSISGGYSGALKSVNTVGDSGLADGIALRGEISLNALCGSVFLKSSADEETGVIQCSLRFLLNGKDLTDRLASAAISFYGKESFSSFSAVIAEPAVRGSKAEFVIEGRSYIFVTEKTKRSGSTVKISGRAVQALYESPYAGQMTVFETDTTASALAGDALWGLRDYSVPLIRGSWSETGILKKLAEECGASVRICADGITRAVNPYSAENTMTLNTFFEAVKTSEAPKYSGIRVLSGFSAEPVLELEEKKVAKGSFASAHVYVNGSVSISSDASLLKSAGGRVIETEEKVRFSDGAGKTSYPVFRVISGADAAEGRSVYVRDTAGFVRTVRYETVRHDCLLYEGTEGDSVLRAEAVKTLHCAGSGTAIREFGQSLTDDPSAAALRAENLHRTYGGGSYLEITHLFSPAAASGDALFMRTPAGDGHCIASSVEITSSPLKIIQKTKLHIREKING
ncbi:hypothetical protein EP073_12010 [Geovibrio thiophilus]|uniref:Uncharacterized protein n=1 Tax=Geovibrio thiophilus TaxID=139438 RepID=A0A3R5V2Q0_9BACT|nr:hypothetical protein [Geovibrio thiophilus]QAR34101.1 hypothetical protein EP073_12010 [Geovibrio thiophilus]